MNKRINRNVSVQDLIDLHQIALELYGGPGGIRDEGTLYYLVDKASHYRNPIEISSVLLHGIATLHPFNDGNKRVSLMAACLVLGLYDSVLTASNEESKIFVLSIAKYEITEEQVRYWILKNSIMSKSH